MKKRLLYLSAAIVAMFTASCGTLVTAPPDMVVGGGIYPPAIMVPPPSGPNIFRPGAPNGPGFRPGVYPIQRPGIYPNQRPIYNGRPTNRPNINPPAGMPNNPPAVNPGGPGSPGGPGGNPGGPGGPGGSGVPGRIPNK